MTSNELHARWQFSHDQRAYRELLERYGGFARKVARRYARRRLSRDRTRMAAEFGLSRAIATYDPHGAVQFLPFAARAILHEVRRELRRADEAAAGAGTSDARAAEQLLEMRDRIASTLGHSPGVLELAEYAELSVEDVIEALEALPPRGSRGAWPVDQRIER